MNVEPYDAATCAQLQLRLHDTPGYFTARERRLVATIRELRRRLLEHELAEIERRRTENGC